MQIIGILIEVALITGYLAQLIPTGLVIYGHAMLCANILVWIAKLMHDSPASRYTHFVVFLASILVAGAWGIIAPFCIPKEFWDPYEPCTSTTVKCIATNTCVILLTIIILFL